MKSRITTALSVGVTAIMLVWGCVQGAGAAEAQDATTAPATVTSDSERAMSVPADRDISAASTGVAVSTETLVSAADPVKPVSPSQWGEATPPASGEAGLRFNFQGVSLTTILDYLSKTAGFVIVREAEVNGKLNLTSHQSLNKDEAVELLNTVLNEKGYAAIRNSRTLTILSCDEAKKRNLPVRMGSDPEKIPNNEEMVTQIMPIRYGSAAKLLDELKSVRPANAVVTANESSNAIIITDTQANIRRFAEVVKALDTSVAGISALKVFPLNYADATELAKVVTQIFLMPSSSSSRDSRDSRIPDFIAQMRDSGGKGKDDKGRSSSGDSVARQVAARVVAVADTRTNSLVVSASNELMPVIEDLVKQIDTVTEGLTELRVFPLQFADATEMAAAITQVFQPDSSQNRDRQRFHGFFGGPFGGPPRDSSSSRQDQNPRQLAEERVVAVADTRTNSVVVSAATETMALVEQMIKQLDSNPAKSQKVFVYSLDNANVEDIAGILRAAFQEGTSGKSGSSATRKSSSSQSSSSRSSSSGFGDFNLGGSGGASGSQGR